MNMGVQISVQVLGFISSEDGIFLEIKLLVNTVKFFFFFFLEPTIAVASFYFPIIVRKGSNFSISLPTLATFWVFDSSHANGV